MAILFGYVRTSGVTGSCLAGGCEQPEQTIVREVHEELGIELVSPRLIDMYIWEKDFGTTTHIGIVTFVGEAGARTGNFELQGEAGNAAFQKYTIQDALALDNLPEVYKRAIRKAYE